MLDPTDFFRLIAVLARHRAFASAASRREFFSAAFGEDPRASTILSRLDLDGAPGLVASRAVGYLDELEATSPDAPAFVVLANALLRDPSDGDNADFLSDLSRRHSVADAHSANTVLFAVAAPSGRQLHRLYEAFLDAFQRSIELERMLRHRLDKNLEELATKGPLGDMIFELLRAAHSQAWLDRLVVAARTDQPSNEKLRAAAGELGLESVLAFGRDAGGRTTEDAPVERGPNVVMMRLRCRGNIQRFEASRIMASLENLLGARLESVSIAEIREGTVSLISDGGEEITRIIQAIRESTPASTHFVEAIDLEAASWTEGGEETVICLSPSRARSPRSTSTSGPNRTADRCGDHGLELSPDRIGGDRPDESGGTTKNHAHTPQHGAAAHHVTVPSNTLAPQPACRGEDAIRRIGGPERTEPEAQKSIDIPWRGIIFLGIAVFIVLLVMFVLPRACER